VARDDPQVFQPREKFGIKQVVGHRAILTAEAQRAQRKDILLERL
jgi:hypothetical protein